MALAVVDPLTLPDWDQRLNSLEGTTIFHTRAWAAVLADTYGFARRYLVWPDGDHAYRAVVPILAVKKVLGGTRGVSLPFSDYVPLAARNAGDRQAFAGLLPDAARAQGWRTLELRCGAWPFADARPAQTHYQHDLELIADSTSMFGRLKNTTRTAVRKAEAAGVQVKPATGVGALREFCRLNTLTRRRHGLPPQPQRFFQAIEQYLLLPGLGEIWFASQAGRTIAAALFLLHGTEVLFKFGCSDHRFQHTRANDLLMWSAIQGYAQRAYRRLSLGRSEAEHGGLRRFKAGLGAQETALHYYKYDVDRSAFVTETAHATAWYNPVFRVLPLWVNQCAGGLFYKFAA